MRKFLGFAAAALIAASLAGCGDKGGGGGGGAAGGSSGGGGPAGTWVMDSAGLKESLRPKMAAEVEKQKAELAKLPADQRAMAEKLMPSLDKMVDVAFEQVGKMSMEMTLEGGGAASFVGDMGGKQESGKGTWKLDGDKVVITATEKNGKPVTDEDRKDIPPLVFKNGRLSLEEDGMVLPFKRK